MKPHPWINRQMAASCGKPVLVPKEVWVNGEWEWSGKWNMPRPSGDLLLSFRRCSELDAPVEVAEDPCGYVYKANMRTQFRYEPLYPRWIEQLNLFRLNDLERRALVSPDRRRGMNSGNRRYLVCLSCGLEANPGSCPACGSELQIKLEWPYFIPNLITEGLINMEQAIAKLQAEMEGAKDNAYVQLIGNFLLQYIEGAPDAAGKVVAEGKTLKGSLSAMKSEAKKKAVDGMAMLTDAEGYGAVLKYYGIQGDACPAHGAVVSAPAAPAPVILPKPDLALSLDDLLVDL